MATKKTQTQTWTLVSCKGTRGVIGSLLSAYRAARVMVDELQPAYGVSIVNDNGETVAEVA